MATVAAAIAATTATKSQRYRLYHYYSATCAHKCCCMYVSEMSEDCMGILWNACRIKYLAGHNN